MKNMNITSVTAAVGGAYHGDNSVADTEISMVTTDSRKIEKNGLFIAIKGERSDGHDYIGQCLDNGAAAVISEREIPNESRPVIVVESTLVALRDLAAFYRSQLDIKVVGITGSVGKTSTKETIASVLSTKYRVLKTAGNFNNEIGLPLTVFRLTEDDEVAVLEMGISDFGEMSRLTAIAKPDIAVITNIGQCHLENLGTRDGILKAKTEIFKGMGADGVAVLNADDDKLITVGEVCGKPPVHFGIENKSGIYAKNIQSRGLLGTDACLCNVACADGVSEFAVHISVPGSHMVYNAMAAAAVGALLGLTSGEIAEGIASMNTIAGRNNIIKTENLLILDDCYNANPVSMKSSIDVIALAEGRKICILGDMFELGRDEEKLHYEVGQYMAGKNVDLLLTAGKLAKNIAAGAKDSGAVSEIHSFEKRDELLDALPQLLKKGDNILVKASHGMVFTEVVKALENTRF
jgi:UDP-N-acetylmuramoyl-tripeptide--D-alanyl-D-alanine ligase